MSSCPSCGSSRMRSAPLPVVSWAALPLGRHRYTCTQCGRAMWSHRLRRRTITVRGRTERRELRGREIAFFAVIVFALVFGVILVAQSCRSFPGEPAPSQPAAPSVTPIRPGL